MADNAAVQSEKDMQAKAITQIANVSKLLRDAIAASIPVAPEQYLCISVPGTTIDVTEIKDGGTFVYGVQNSAFVPPAVRQAEASLVDGMIPLANVMIGNTGKSVSRSYSRALDGLVPRKATVKSGVNQIRSPGEPSYDQAMQYLTMKDPSTGLTPVDVYIEKQHAWADSQDAWDRAKIKAQNAAIAKFPDDQVLQRQEMDNWNQANFRKYKFAVQGKWMDWVSNGDKYNVEYNFGIVDTESIMARVESSKESMRNSTMVDTDGANEIQGVNLTPKNWATLCKEKSDGWFRRNGDYSIEQLDAEIARLQRLATSYDVLATLTAADTATYPLANPSQPGVTIATSTTDLSAMFKALYVAQGAVNEIKLKIRAKQLSPDDQTVKDALEGLKTARNNLDLQIQKDKETHAAWVKYQNATLSGDSKASVQTWLAGTRQTIADQIAALNQKRAEKQAAEPVNLSAISGAHSGGNGTGSGSDVALPGSELADPVFGGSAPAGSDPNMPTAGTASDPWTTISASFSAADQNSTNSTSSWGMSVGGGAGWGLWSVGGSYAHEESQRDSVSDMASCDVNVSFSALVVNIGRPWLYGELFDDFELDVAADIMLSPGAEDLHRLMANQIRGTDPNFPDMGVVSELAQYNSFPAYPTSMIIAADTVIEFNGDTQHIEEHFSSHSNSGSTSVGWGPFSVSSSFHESASKQSYQVQSTATGCRLSFGAPQVIGWVSQILPALPRKPGFEPMVQNVVV